MSRSRRRSACGPSPDARWPIRSPTTPPHAGSCSCSTPATRRSAPPRRWCPSSCAAAPEPRCWPPAGNRSACPARWSGGSRRCRCAAPPAADPATRWPCWSIAPPRRAAATRRPPTRSPSSTGWPRRSPGCRWPWSWRPRGCGYCRRASWPRAWTTCSARSMPATVTWSYRTLDTEAAKLLRWLSVFAGPVELPAIEWLIGSDPLARLARLVDKSLLLAEPSPAGTTYRMLDPIRAYAAKRLVDAGEEEAARNRHVAWCLHATHQANRDRAGRPVTVSLYALDPLADELRAALHWAVTRGSLRQGFALAGGLDQWWRERGLAREGRMWLFRLYDRISSSGGRISNADVAEAYRMHSLHAGADGEYVEELHFSQRAEAAARRSSDPGLLARVLSGRGAAVRRGANRAVAAALFARGVRSVLGRAAERGTGGARRRRVRRRLRRRHPAPAGGGGGVGADHRPPGHGRRLGAFLGRHPGRLTRRVRCLT